MRLIDLDKYKETRDRLTKRLSMFYGIIVSVIVFILLLLGGEFLTGLLVGVIVGVAFFLTVYGIRRGVDRGKDRKYKKLELTAPHCEVTYGREEGVLQFFDDKLLYTTITPGAQHKKIEIPITEKLFMSVNKLKKSKIQSYSHGNLEQGAITMKEMPHGLIHQFQFLDIDGLLEKVDERVSEISRYIHEE